MSRMCLPAWLLSKSTVVLPVQVVEYTNPVDGLHAGNRQHPPVNPWRHAYTRAKHFRHALRSHNALFQDECGWVDDWYWRWSYSLAMDNADWGCR